MTAVVVAVALAVAFVNLLPAAAGGWEWWRGALGRGPTAKGFWILVRAGQVSAVAMAAWVGVLALIGRYSSDRLFYLYALLPLAISFIAEQMRIASAQAILDRWELEDAQAVGELPEAEQHRVVAAIVSREIAVMALAAVVVVFLALRAAGTAHGF